MKALIGGFITGVVFIGIFYILFPLLIEGRMIRFTSKVISTMTQQALITGLVFALVMYVISLASKRNRRKRELEDAMKKYFESKTNHFGDSEM